MTAIDQTLGTGIGVSSPGRRPRRPAGKRAARIRATVVSVVLLLVLVVWIYPFLWMVGTSLKSNDEVYDGLDLFPRVLQLGNYIRAWQEANVGQYFMNTVLVTGGSVLISVIAVALTGYVLGRYKFPGKKIVIGLFGVAMFIPEGYTIIPIFDLLRALGLSESLVGLTLAESGGAHVVATLLFAGYFAQLPRELEEAARIDGAGFFRIFWQVYLPLAKPVTATAVILQFMHSWNDFLLPLVLTLPNPEIRTLSVGIYSFQGEYFSDWSGMAAAVTIGLAPIVILFLFLQRYFVEGVAGAVKQ